MSGIIGEAGSRSGIISPSIIRVARSQYIYAVKTTDITSTTSMILSEYAEGMFHVNMWGGGGSKADIINISEDSTSINTGIQSTRGTTGTTTYSKGGGTSALNLQNSTNVSCTIMGFANGSMAL